MPEARFRGPQGPWEEVFLWKPVYIGNRWHWLTKGFRRKRNLYVYPDQGYEYGTVFDVLRDPL